MKANTKFSFRQIFFVVAGVGLVALVIFNNRLGWTLPWYLQILFIVAGLVCGVFAMTLSDEAEKQKALSHMAGRPALDDAAFAGNFFSSDRAEIAIRLRKILAGLLSIDLSQMQPTDRFIEDLRIEALDSFGTVEFILEIENEFGIKIPNSVAEKMNTFQEVVDYVAEAVKSKAN